MHAKTMDSPPASLASLVMVSLLGGDADRFQLFFRLARHPHRGACAALRRPGPPAFAIGGVIPGGPRLFAWKTVLDCLMAYAAMIIYVAAFGAYNAIPRPGLHLHLQRHRSDFPHRADPGVRVRLLRAAAPHVRPATRLLAARISGGAGGSAARSGGRSGTGSCPNAPRLPARQSGQATTNSRSRGGGRGRSRRGRCSAGLPKPSAPAAPPASTRVRCRAPASADADGQNPRRAQ